MRANAKNMMSVYEYMYYMHRLGIMVDYNLALMHLRGEISFMELLAQTDMADNNEMLCGVAFPFYHYTP